MTSLSVRPSRRMGDETTAEVKRQAGSLDQSPFVLYARTGSSFLASVGLTAMPKAIILVL